MIENTAAMFRNICTMVFSIMLFVPTKAQVYGDSLKKIVAQGSKLNVNLQWTAKNYGQIQWQRSDDGLNWFDIPGANVRQYSFIINNPTWLRAKVDTGTCNSFFSKIAHFDVLFMLVDSISELTDTSATIAYHVIAQKSMKIIEKGVLWDTIVDRPYYIFKHPDTSISENSTITLNQLVPGKSYFIRPYAITYDNDIVLGNTYTLITPKITYIDRINPKVNTIDFYYDVNCSEPIDESGVLISSDSTLTLNSRKIIGIPDGKYYVAIIDSLQPATVYYVLPFLVIKGKCYYASHWQKVKTFTDYSTYPVDTTIYPVNHKIVWNNQSTAKRISPENIFADYGRVKRYLGTDTLLLVFHGGQSNDDWVNIYCRRSFDNGMTWEETKLLMEQAKYANKYWRFCNPELLVLHNGTILLAYEANAKDDENNSSIQILFSNDTGRTWEGPKIIKVGRSWEPAMVQLPGGEIELFYSSEAHWWPPVNNSYVEQEIMMMRSTDNGKTWSLPQTVAYYPYKRDGMPVPVLLRNNMGVAFTIETVNNNNSPYIVWRPLNQDWQLTTSNFDNSPYRWYAGYFGGHGGAPYIIQLPTGETILSVHRYRGGDWHQNNDMQVMIGNNRAKNFEQLTTPYLLPMGESAVNNSLFLKDSTTIVAISCRMFTVGLGGIYWLEGQILPK
ncbi:MAG: sialidase family protein [Bacteroidales bacterium]